MRLISDIEEAKIKELFKLLKAETFLFDGLTMAEVEQMIPLFRVVKFASFEKIAAKDDPVDFFGIILSGKAVVTLEQKEDWFAD